MTTREAFMEWWFALPDRGLRVQRVMNEVRSHQIEQLQAMLKVPRFRARQFAPDTTPTGRWHPTGSRREKAHKRELRRLYPAQVYARQFGVAWEDVPPHVRAAIERGCRPTRHLRGVIVTWECRCVTAHGDGQGYILPAPPEPAA